MEPVKISKPKKGTWLGREATWVEYSYDKSANGKRIFVQNWTDGGHSIRCIKGDGRTPKFRLFESIDYPATAPEAEIRLVVDCMAAIHFGSNK